jgi:hypothetical protein
MIVFRAAYLRGLKDLNEIFLYFSFFLGGGGAEEGKGLAPKLRVIKRI